MEETIKIPEERIGALIGPSGKTKRKIMQTTNAIIEIDSHTGEIFIQGEGENYFKAADIVKAIGRGFSPERAFNLLKQNYLLKILNIPEYVGGNKSAQEVKRGRVIGKEGSARSEIEKKTNSFISVYGKTVSIIAPSKNIEEATHAIELLLKGSAHEAMHNFLEHKGKNRFEL